MGTATPATVLDPELERRLAAALFNHVWTLLERPRRTADDGAAMVHAAHAAAYHWGVVGDVCHHARSEWQCSRVYAVLGRAEPALHHAVRCLALCDRGPVDDFDRPAALEALARAHVVAGDGAAARRCLEEGRAAAAGIADEDDRLIVTADLDDVERLLRAPPERG